MKILTKQNDIDRISTTSIFSYYINPKKEGDIMTDKTMMTATEVAEALNVSKGKDYKIIRKLNDELASQGYIVISGRVPKAYWQKKFYGLS